MSAHRQRKPIPWLRPRTNVACSLTCPSQTVSRAANSIDSTAEKIRTAWNSGTARRLGGRPWPLWAPFARFSSGEWAGALVARPRLRLPLADAVLEVGERGQDEEGRHEDHIPQTAAPELARDQPHED